MIYLSFRKKFNLIFLISRCPERGKHGNARQKSGFRQTGAFRAGSRRVSNARAGRLPAFRRKKIFNLILSTYLVILLIGFSDARAQTVKRIVILKTDGTSGDLIDRFVSEKNPATGKSLLPWFEEVFYHNGTHLKNFYVRGISLSAPSWSILDTGQHLQIKGNVEYDRLTLHGYDYLNLFPFYIGYGFNKVADLPAVEVLNELQIPITSDAFDFENRYTSPQLIQRGNNWKVFGTGAVNFLPKNPSDFIDEWTIGFDFRNLLLDQNERDIIYKIKNNPKIKYFDIYTGELDHISHGNNDLKSQIFALQDLDRMVGRIWTAIQTSPQADETALVVVSDHGFNTDEKVYSQGFNLVKLLGSADGGAHHVAAKRRLMLDYSVKGLYPLVPLITTESKDSFYLRGRQNAYPTALIDFDGNERASFHLRNSDLNTLQILWQQLEKNKLPAAEKNAALDYFFSIIDRSRKVWLENIAEISDELGALQRWREVQEKIIAAAQKTYTPEEYRTGVHYEARRTAAQKDIAVREEQEYRAYLRVLSNLSSLRHENFHPEKLKIEDYIGKGVMGEHNSVYQLQNYVAGLSNQGLVLDNDGKLDFEKSFKRLDYFKLLSDQTVRNNVQREVGNRPVDFSAVSIPLDQIADQLPADLLPDQSFICLFGANNKQSLVLSREDQKGNSSFRYLPVSNLRQNIDGKFTFQIEKWSAGFPLKIYEDENLKIPRGVDKISWLDAWHGEDDWMNATHRTIYSNAVIGLNEQLARHQIPINPDKNSTGDDQLLTRFRQRQREMAEVDILVLANNHWNFDVRGFNPGGNHGSFFRVSTISALMFAGGDKTGIPRGLTIEKPYDSLSLAPTILALTGNLDADNQPFEVLKKKGFTKFPGKIIRELLTSPANK